MKILVTGANGFLGRAVVNALLEKGHSVRALARSPQVDGRVEVFQADLRTAKDLTDAFRGVDALVHLAASMRGGEVERFNETVMGTERLLEAMARSQTRRIVLAGTFSVYDWCASHFILDENSPLEKKIYERDGYAIAKFWQERVVRRICEKEGWTLTVLRPGFIWGRGQAYVSGVGIGAGPLQIVIGGIRQLPLTHVDNCANVFAAAVDDPKAAGQTFNVVDGFRISRWRFTGIYLKNMRPNGFRVYLPYHLALGICYLAYGTSKLLFKGKGKLPGIFIPRRFKARFKPMFFSNKKLRETLGWTPPYNFQQCVQRTYGR